MRKLFITLFMVLSLMVLPFSVAFATCTGPDCVNQADADVSGIIYGDPMNNSQQSHNTNGEDQAAQSGQTAHSFDVDAAGNESASAIGGGFSSAWGDGFAFQTEIGGGELSGAGGLAIGTSRADGDARGVDNPDCHTTPDYAGVDLEVFGVVSQGNNAYSDDLASSIGGGNTSTVDFWGQTDDYDNGAGSGNHDAAVSDRISGTGITGGITLVYADNTDTTADVRGITGNFGTACFIGAEQTDVLVTGMGMITGAAVLPGNGYASFNASFNYSGPDFGYGVAGGYANVTNITSVPGYTSVSSSASAFSSVSTGGYSGPSVK